MDAVHKLEQVALVGNKYPNFDVQIKQLTAWREQSNKGDGFLSDANTIDESVKAVETASCCTHDDDWQIQCAAETYVCSPTNCLA